MKNKKIISTILFLILAWLTFDILFKDQSFLATIDIVKNMKPIWILLAFISAIIYVSLEGIMIWYLLRVRGCKHKAIRCIMYSFIGFFYSGVTPSATGGQPMQLYYMSKDKLKIGDSTVVLMTVATIYKLVLVIIGGLIAVFCYPSIKESFDGYIYLYWLGLFLNLIVVIILVAIITSPKFIRAICMFFERFMVKIKLLKPSEQRVSNIEKLSDDYRHTVSFFMRNKTHIMVTLLLTFTQRMSLFIITVFVYLGMGYTYKSLMELLYILIFQAAICVAVDMLPLPGAQGISEILYQTIFGTIFIGPYLTTSALVTRGFSFYLLLLIGALVSLHAYFYYRKRDNS